MAGNILLGLGCCIIAGIGFGSNYLPVKKIAVGDGVFFSVSMAWGILLVGLLINFTVADSDYSLAPHRPPKFEPLAAVGGMMWMCGNLMCPLIVQKIGLGLGLAVWDCANLIMGWATGNFGLFGVWKEEVPSPAMNYAGVFLACVSLVLLAFAGDDDGDEDEQLQEEERKNKTDPSEASTDLESESNSNNPYGSSEQGPAANAQVQDQIECVPAAAPIGSTLEYLHPFTGSTGSMNDLTVTSSKRSLSAGELKYQGEIKRVITGSTAVSSNAVDMDLCDDPEECSACADLSGIGRTDGSMIRLSQITEGAESAMVNVRSTRSQQSTYEELVRVRSSRSNNKESMARPQLPWERFGEQLSPSRQRQVAGFVLSILTGCAFGLTFDLPTDLMQLGKMGEDHSTNPMDYVFSHFCGIAATGTVALSAYVLIRRRESYMPSNIIMPAMASGVIWGIAQVAWFQANVELSLVVAFPIISTLPGIIGMIWGYFLFGEFSSRRSRQLAAAGMALRIPAVILIALSGLI
uniref:Transmembrane protein 144 n=1 Tax=Strombidinopsis acuminata TaxID=141414 RepID=A0A7S3WM05_9SPIT|mmetsp:Transcript_44456/g.60300  ORF Transcript_44456/g.60300 Transcript_44456/m.60300 type:complete len:521 (+) Transcript_44456:99-1661(+)